MSSKIKILLKSLAVLILLSILLIIFLMNYISKTKNYAEVFSTPVAEATISNTGATDKNNQGKIVDTSSLINQESVVNILFLGIDRTDYRDKTLGVYRTDTILFTSINLNTKKVKVLSIPRDSYVYIPVIDKKDKINHAYVWGGMGKEGINSTIDTIENFIKYKKVDYYFALDMEPLVEIVDSLGGVELEVEIDMKTNGANLSAGYQLLDGQKAFDYIHWRFSGNGDIDRIGRQQKFIKILMEKVKKEGNILDFLNIVLKYKNHIRTNLTTTQLLALTNLYRELSEDDIVFLNTSGHEENIDGISYWISDEKVIENFKE